MILDNSNELVATARALVSKAKEDAVSNHKDIVELNQAMAALVHSTFASDDVQNVTSKVRKVKAVLSLIDDMTADTANTTLSESGVRASALVLRSIPMASAHVSSQGADEVSLYSAHTVDACLAKLAQLCDDAAAYLEKAAVAGKGKGELPSDIAERIQLSLVIIESLNDCLDCMREGNDGLLRSQDIWKSTLEQCRPIAAYLSKIFAAVCRLFAVSTGQAFVHSQELLHQRLSLYKHCSKLIEAISGIFGSETHLTTDLGMKRSLMERFCDHGLAAHKALLSAPPSLKAVLTSLCAIATRFSAASFDNAKQCQNVVVRCSGTVRELASQLMTLLPRLDSTSMQDPKINKRVKSSLMVIRFIVFRISALLPRARSQEARSAALAMLDSLFGEVLSAKTLLRLPSDISSTVVALICAVSRKFALSLLTSDALLVAKYLDILGQRRTGEVMPLIKGLSHCEAHCEIIRIVCCELGSFSVEDQTRLLGHKSSVLAAFALAMDHDPLFVLLPATGDNYTDSIEQQKDCSAYQQLVASVAASARCLPSAVAFKLWESAVFTGAIHGSGRSLGYKILFEAWKLLARFGLDPAAIEATIDSIISVILEDENIFVNDEASRTLSDLFSALVKSLPHQNRRICSKSILERLSSNKHVASRLVLVCILPWDVLDCGNADNKYIALVASMAEDILQSISKSSIKGSDIAVAFAAFEAIVPGIRTLDIQRKSGLFDAMFSRAYTELEKCLAADRSTDSQSTTVAILSVATSCIEDSSVGASKILSLCAQNIGRPLFAAEKPIALLSRFSGNFALAGGITSADMASAMASLQAVVSHVLQDDRPWIAQHELLVHIVQAASDADKESLVQALVRNGGEDHLVRFIGKQANGIETADIGTQGAVYSHIFNDNTGLHNGLTNGTAAGSGELGDSSRPNGSSERKTADMITSMRWMAGELKANTHRTIPKESSQAFRDSFLSLYSELERVSRDI